LGGQTACARAHRGSHADLRWLGDQGLHTRGSLEGFERLGSRHKWLFTHGRRKWETFYSAEAKDYQRRFLDHFLKGEENGWEKTPRVRLEIRQNRTRYAVRSEPAWPLQNVDYRPLYLDANDGLLHPTGRRDSGKAVYEPQTRTSRASFIYRFQGEAELTGSMSLKLWVSTTEGDDLDLFVLARKSNADGREVCFSGYNGFAKDGVAKGWLRVSHRALDSGRSRPGRPMHAHLREEKVRAGEIVPVQIEILASSTLFEPGSSLRVDILATDPARYPAFKHGRSVSRLARHRLDRTARSRETPLDC
jgi:hypothetical protein